MVLFKVVVIILIFSITIVGRPGSCFPERLNRQVSQNHSQKRSGILKFRPGIQPGTQNLNPSSLASVQTAQIQNHRSRDGFAHPPDFLHIRCRHPAINGHQRVMALRFNGDSNHALKSLAGAVPKFQTAGGRRRNRLILKTNLHQIDLSFDRQSLK
jgi:hypothetical protein